MSKPMLMFLAIISLLGICAAEEITGTIQSGAFLDFIVLDPKVCGQSVYTVRIISNDFTLEPPAGCSFCDPDSVIEYWVSVAHDNDGDTVHDPGEPLGLYGPFNVDAITCSYDIPDPIVKITSGGFSGTISNATRMLAIDSIMINIYHHYIGSSLDTYQLQTTLPPQNLVDLTGGNWGFQMTGIASGGKRIEFFSDANNNNILDPGERTSVLERDVPITGNQYDDSVDCDLLTLNVPSRSLMPQKTTISAHPNPFNSAVTITISNLEDYDNLLLIDVTGRLVRKFHTKSNILWDGTDMNGCPVPTGVCFATLEKNRDVKTRIWLIR